MFNRSLIRDKEFVAQVCDFSGLSFGNIYPTNIDGYCEYQNLCHVFIETKFNNSKFSRGQILAFERLADDLSKVKPTLFIVSSHWKKDDIDLANTIVTRFRLAGEWRIPIKNINVHDAIDKFFKDVKHGNINKGVFIESKKFQDVLPQLKLSI